MKALSKAFTFWNQRRSALSRVGVELNEADLSFVAGGAPKGTWGTQQAKFEQNDFDVVDAPKGTW